MIPPRFRSLLQGLPTQSAPNVGPTRAAALARAPKSIDGTWPSAPAPMSTDQLTDMAIDASTPLAMGSVAKRGAQAAAKPLTEIARDLWHGTGADPFDKFVREKMGLGSGGNRLGLGVYGTEAMSEGMEYLRNALRQAGKVPKLITSRGREIEVPVQLATDLKAGRTTLDELIATRQQALDRAQKTLQGTSSRFLKNSAEKSVSQNRDALFDLLTARDEQVTDIVRPGSLFNMAAEVDPEKLLNYEKELIDQSPFVQEAVKGVLGIPGRIIPHSPNQQVKYARMMRELGTPEITQRLEDAGVQGTVARSATYGALGEQPLNLAVFNPDRVSILRTLGLAGMLGAGASRANRQQPTTTTQDRM